MANNYLFTLPLNFLRLCRKVFKVGVYYVNTIACALYYATDVFLPLKCKCKAVKNPANSSFFKEPLRRVSDSDSTLRYQCRDRIPICHFISSSVFKDVTFKLTFMHILLYIKGNYFYFSFLEGEYYHKHTK